MNALEMLGLTKEQAEEKVIEKIAERLLVEIGEDPEDGSATYTDSPFAAKIKQLVEKRIDQSMAKMAEKHVLPNVGAFIEGILLKPTNQYGESTGKPRTLAEEMVRRAEAYITEQVDSDGRKASGYGSFNQPRIVQLVDKYLGMHIKNAIEKSLGNAHDTLAKAIETTVKDALDHWSKAATVHVKKS